MSFLKYLRFKEIKRVLQITKKPNKEEAKTIIKVTSLGMVIIGVIGFVISIITKLLR